MVKVDLRDNPDTMPCGLNPSESCCRTAAAIGIFTSIDELAPTNAGSFRRIKIRIREGSIAGGGKHPTNMSVAATNPADRVTNQVQVAFSMIKDGPPALRPGIASTVQSGRTPFTRHGWLTDR